MAPIARAAPVPPYRAWGGISGCECWVQAYAAVAAIPMRVPQAAEGRQEQGFGQELLGDVAAGGAEGAAQADLGAAFEDRDDHDVGDADTADEQGDGSQAEEQAVVGASAATSASRIPDSSVTCAAAGLAGSTVSGSTAATATTWLKTART